MSVLAELSSREFLLFRAGKMAGRVDELMRSARQFAIEDRDGPAARAAREARIWNRSYVTALKRIRRDREAA